MRAAPMLEETASTFDAPTQPSAAWSWMTWAPMARLPFPQSMGSSGRSAPRSRAPAMVKVFIVEPGSKASVTARLRSSSARRGAFGLKVGAAARASTSPVRGSRAIAMPESAREPVTARASARSAASCSPWSMVSSTRAPSRSRPAEGAPASTVRPAPSRSEGTFAGAPREQVVEGELDALEAVPVVADDAEDLAGQLALRVVAAGLLHEGDAAELAVLHHLLDGARGLRRDAARDPGEARALEEPLAHRRRLEAEDAVDPPERGPAVLLGEDEGVGVDRAGVGAAGEQHAGAVGDRAAPRLQHELPPVLVDHVADEVVLVEHLQLEDARGDRGEARREERGEDPDAQGDPARGARVGARPHPSPPRRRVVRPQRAPEREPHPGSRRDPRRRRPPDPPRRPRPPHRRAPAPRARKRNGLAPPDRIE